MFFKLATLFIVLPIVELILLIWLGDVLSFWPTVGIIITTGVVGSWLARVQGRAVLRSIQAELQRGALPGDPMIDGLLVLVAGALMVTPGLITDVTGMLFLVPPIRRVVRNRIKKWFTSRIESGAWQTHGTWQTRRGPWRGFDDDVIDITPDPDLQPSTPPSIH